MVMSILMSGIFLAWEPYQRLRAGCVDLEEKTVAVETWNALLMVNYCVAEQKPDDASGEYALSGNQ